MIGKRLALSWNAFHLMCEIVGEKSMQTINMVLPPCLVWKGHYFSYAGPWTPEETERLKRLVEGQSQLT